MLHSCIAWNKGKRIETDKLIEPVEKKEINNKKAVGKSLLDAFL